MTYLSRVAIFTIACGLSASAAGAGDLKLSIANGRVTLIAQDVPVRQILAEWARIGRTTIVNGDKVVGPSVTLQLVDQPEREALEILLRTAAGYVAAPRSVAMTDASLYDRILILPTSRPPAFTASAPPPQFSRPPQPVQDDDQPVGDIAPMVPPQAPPGMTYPGQGVPGQNVPPQQIPQTVPGQPNQPAQQPLTAPRPGMLPSVPGVQPQPATPYGTPTQPLPPGVRPPGPGGPGGPGL